MAHNHIQHTTNSINALNNKLTEILTVSGINISNTVETTNPILDGCVSNNKLAVSGTFYQATQPVSGAFYQATQPVSGTFYQATQPVSGSFYQATQPVSGSFYQATQPVSGSFYQATQPISIASVVGTTNTILDSCVSNNELSVSGEFYQATQPVSGSVSLLPAVDPTLCVGTVRLTDVYGQPIVTTAGLLMTTIAGINTNAPLHTILDSGDVSVSNFNETLSNLNATSLNGAFFQNANILYVNSPNNLNSVQFEITPIAEITPFKLGQQVLVKGCTIYPQLNGLRTIIEVVSSYLFKMYAPDFVGTNEDDIAETGTISSFGQSPLLTDENGKLLVNVSNDFINVNVDNNITIGNASLDVQVINTVDIAMSASLPQGQNLIGKMMTILEPPLSVLNITTITEGTSIQILPNSGSLLSFSPTNEGASGTICWYKFYNKLSATNADTPIFKYGITSSMNNTIAQINMNNLVFDTAISVRATLNYVDNDNTAPTGTQSLLVILSADYS